MNIAKVSDKLIIKNTTGDMFSKGIIYSNNIHGDLSSSTKLFQNNELFMTITPNSKIFQLKRSFSDGFKGVGITTNGMVFSKTNSWRRHHPKIDFPEISGNSCLGISGNQP